MFWPGACRVTMRAGGPVMCRSGAGGVPMDAGRGSRLGAKGAVSIGSPMNSLHGWMGGK